MLNYIKLVDINHRSQNEIIDRPINRWRLRKIFEIAGNEGNLKSAMEKIRKEKIRREKMQACEKKKYCETLYFSNDARLRRVEQ